MSEGRVLYRAIDTWADESSPGTTHEKDAALYLRGGVDQDKYAYIFFPLPFAPGEANVISASLEIFTDGAWSGTTLITVQRLTTTWIENLLSWNNKPTQVGTNAGSVSAAAPADKTKLTISLTAMFQDVASGSAYYGLMISVDTAGDKKIHGDGAADISVRPRFLITYGTTPMPPANLRPGGDLHISLAKPILSWQFRDFVGDTAQASYQVQIDDAADFASPEYDSGIINAPESQHDLGPTGYGGVPDLARRWWRVNTKDADGYWSGYSDPVSFQRTTKATLTITNPPSGTPTVSDLQPAITWTFVGRTQSMYQVLIYKVTAAKPDAPIYDSGVIKSAATSHNIPSIHNGSKVLDRESQTYKLVLRVWDTIDRTGITGDPDYVEATRNFTYVRSGAPAAVTSLAAIAAGPGVQLDWSRSVAPDYFALKEDGVILQDRIVPADVFVSGTSYRKIFYGSDPKTQHTYEIEAVVLTAGKYEHSDGNVTANFTPGAKGLWIIDETSGEQVVILGPQGTEMSISEDTEIKYPIGRRDPVLVFTRIGGYEGTAEGYLIDFNGVTAETYRQRLERIKGKGHRHVVRMVFKTYSFPVLIGQISIDPSTEHPNLFEVSVAWFQKGEFFEADL